MSVVVGIAIERTESAKWRYVPHRAAVPPAAPYPGRSYSGERIVPWRKLSEPQTFQSSVCARISRGAATSNRANNKRSGFIGAHPRDYGGNRPKPDSIAAADAN